MLCPKCNTPISDQTPRCPQCNFEVHAMGNELSYRPILQGHVNDFANILSPDEKKSLESLLKEFREKNGIDVVVVTQKNTSPLTPAQYVFWLYNEWGIGGKKHHGVMILLALEERRIETEVGFGLEHILTDEESGKILDREMIQPIKEGRYGDGLYFGAKAIIQALSLSPK